MRTERRHVWRIAAAGLWLGLLATAASAQDGVLPPGDARVAGRVVAADTGAPLVGARVTLQAVKLPSGAAYVATSDAGGAFEFPAIIRGEYRITADKAGFYMRARGAAGLMGQVVTAREGQTLSGVTVPLMRGGAIAGRVVDSFGDPVERVRVYAQRLEYRADGARSAFVTGVNDVTNDLGEFRVYALVPGDYLIVTAGRNAAIDALNTFNPFAEAESAPTYYPGTANVAEAQVVSVGAGETAFVSIPLTDTRLVSVSGTVHLSNGRPATGLQVTIANEGTAMVVPRTPISVSETGAFSIDSVPPGTYRLHVLPRPPLRERGSVQVTIGTEDVDDVAIVTHPGTTVSGTVVFERPFTGNLFQLVMSSTFSGTAASDPIGPDGRFEIRGVEDGTFLSPVTPGWIATSIIIDGREVVDEPIEFGGRRSVSGVRVTVTDALAQVSGTAVDERGRPLGDHLILLIREGTNLPLARQMTTFRTDQSGAFTARGLRPGSYVAGVIDDIEPGYANSSRVQDAVRIRGQRFEAAAGQPLTLVVTSIPGL